MAKFLTLITPLLVVVLLTGSISWVKPSPARRGGGGVGRGVSRGSSGSSSNGRSKGRTPVRHRPDLINIHTKKLPWDPVVSFDKETIKAHDRVVESKFEESNFYYPRPCRAPCRPKYNVTYDEWKENVFKDGLICRNDEDCSWLKSDLYCEEDAYRPLKGIKERWFQNPKGKCSCPNGYVWDVKNFTCEMSSWLIAIVVLSVILPLFCCCCCYCCECCCFRKKSSSKPNADRLEATAKINGYTNPQLIECSNNPNNSGFPPGILAVAKVANDDGTPALMMLTEGGQIITLEKNQDHPSITTIEPRSLIRAGAEMGPPIPNLVTRRIIQGMVEIENNETSRKDLHKDLKFLSTENRSHVVDKGGVEVPLSTLQSKDVVALFFSGQWCPPSAMFTPKLIKLYNECKENNKSFEVVFISLDQNEDEFKKYFGKMPWVAISFKDQRRISAINTFFHVKAIPTLILLTGKGELITNHGRKIVEDIGADYFPWNEDQIKRYEDTEREAINELLEVERNVILEQEKMGKIIIRRHVGDPKQISISADHNVEFKSFSTIAAISAIVPEGKKVLYEVTFNEYDGYPISQIGWAMNNLLPSDQHEEHGVGDDANSYSFDGQRQRIWNIDSHDWGKCFAPQDGRVLGVAADLENGKLLFGLDGDWSKPMGVAFDLGCKKDAKLFPAISAANIKLSVNFGDNEFKYGPPDVSYVGLKQALTFTE